MQSFLLKDKKRKRELTAGDGRRWKWIVREIRKRENATGDGSPHVTQPSSPDSGWSLIFRELRKDRDLQDALLHRLRTRGEMFGHLFFKRFEGPREREELHGLFHFLTLPPRSLPPQYRLCFMNNVKNSTFTTDLVGDEKGVPIEVAIVDTKTGLIISDGSFSSVGVRITVLDPDFLTNKGENWSRSEFDQSVLKERERMGSILSRGGHVFRLEKGRGSPGFIIFGDNSRWARFRLGVMLDDKKGCFNGERVQEGVSNCFRVKDRRAKACQKPDQLKLTDGVQCLRRVGKERAKLLEVKNIKTVEDFLCRLHQNKAELRNILGFNSDSDTGWLVMVEHAMECDKEFQNGLSNTNQPQQVLVAEHISLNIDSNQNSFPINNAIQVSPSDEVMTSINTPQDQSSNSSEDHVNRLETNVPLVTDGGSLLIGSGSSEPNPYENNIINQAPSNEYVSTDDADDFLLEILSYLHSPAYQRHFHDTNHMAIRGNMLDSVQQTTGDNGWPQLVIPDDLIPMDDLFANAESIPDANVYVGPLSPRRKVKIKALIKSITWLAVPRKRARIVPPANQTTVPALKA